LPEAARRGARGREGGREAGRDLGAGNGNLEGRARGARGRPMERDRRQVPYPRRGAADESPAARERISRGGGKERRIPGGHRAGAGGRARGASAHGEPAFGPRHRRAHGPGAVAELRPPGPCPSKVSLGGETSQLGQTIEGVLRALFFFDIGGGVAGISAKIGDSIRAARRCPTCCPASTPSRRKRSRSRERAPSSSPAPAAARRACSPRASRTWSSRGRRARPGSS